MKAVKKMKQRSVGVQDKALGERIRARRIEAGWSQDKLAQALGVSFQQVQKYEKGVNRVSATRLADIAMHLGESLDYFNGPQNEKTSALTSLLGDTASQRLLRAFHKIDDMPTRYKIVGLLESITAHAAA